MKTHVQIRWPLITVMRLAGVSALIASILNLLGYGADPTNWRLNMCAGLGWFILATLNECEARLRDANEFGIKADLRHIYPTEKQG